MVANWSRFSSCLVMCPCLPPSGISAASRIWRNPQTISSVVCSHGPPWIHGFDQNEGHSYGCHEEGFVIGGAVNTVDNFWWKHHHGDVLERVQQQHSEEVCVSVVEDVRHDDGQ